jgi:hypothetical protein
MGREESLFSFDDGGGSQCSSKCDFRPGSRMAAQNDQSGRRKRVNALRIFRGPAVVGVAAVDGATAAGGRRRLPQLGWRRTQLWWRSTKVVAEARVVSGRLAAHWIF